MGKRTDVITLDALDGIYIHHPYLFLFQKENWKEYACLFAIIYDFLEEENLKAPYEVIRTLVLKYYSVSQIQNLEQKVLHFFQMSIAELQVLKDSHDHFGQRHVEITRSGKMLLQMIETLLERRVKFSGTGAETLLGALNDILRSRQRLTAVEAIKHHQLKIKSYKDDLQRIRERGLDHAELLPIPHSNEALLSQAEEAAIHILSSIEDVKTSIERQRHELAQSYFEGTRTAGQNVGAVAEFYDRLYSSNEYLSYIQAKSLLSHLQGYSARFAMKNVDLLLHSIRQRELVKEELLRRSQLQTFTQQFQNSDHQIQEKVKAQIKLLQQQVFYATSTDVHGLQNSLHLVLSRMLARKADSLGFFETNPVHLVIPVEFDVGTLELSSLELPQEIASVELKNEQFDEAERRAFFLALVRAEETTLKKITERFRNRLETVREIALSNYDFEFGLTEYYVLSEIDIFDSNVGKKQVGIADLEVATKEIKYVLRNVPLFLYTAKDSNGND